VKVVRAELLKAFTTRLLLWYGLGLLAVLVLVISVHVGSDDVTSLSAPDTQRMIVEYAGLAAVLAVLLGAVLVTAEYAHGTINQSFLAVPTRERLLGAKLAAAVLAAIGLAAFGCAVTLVLAELWYEGRGIPLELGGGTLTPFLGALAASALAAAIGVGVGAILRRQTLAVVLILVWLLIGEAIINVVGDDASYAPGHAVAAVIVAHRDGNAARLGLWPAVSTCLTYAALLVGVGALLVSRSDVESSVS
jgi:ABC-2 type transport system permease protein